MFKTPEEARRAWMTAMGATLEEIERDILENEPTDLAEEIKECEAMLWIKVHGDKMVADLAGEVLQRYEFPGQWVFKNKKDEYWSNSEDTHWTDSSDDAHIFSDEEKNNLNQDFMKNLGNFVPISEAPELP